MKKMTEEECISDLKRVRDELSKIPTRAEYYTFGQHGYNTLVRKFGTWSKVLLEVFGETNIFERRPYVDIVCANCGKQGTRKFSETVKTNNNFCNSSCAAVYNNKKYPKIKRMNKCRQCGESISTAYSYCDDCISQGKHLPGGQPLGEKTIQEASLKDGSNKSSAIRGHGRCVAKSIPDECAICGYSKHVDICHKKGINKFPKTALVAEVNHKDNLMKLCKNHHWEFDHGTLDDKDKAKIDIQ